MKKKHSLTFFVSEFIDKKLLSFIILKTSILQAGVCELKKGKLFFYNQAQINSDSPGAARRSTHAHGYDSRGGGI